MDGSSRKRGVWTEIIIIVWMIPRYSIGWSFFSSIGKLHPSPGSGLDVTARRPYTRVSFSHWDLGLPERDGQGTLLDGRVIL